MAGYNGNRYQYETSPRKLQPEYTPQKRKNTRKNNAKQNTKISEQKNKKTAKKQDAKNKIKVFSYVCIAFIILFAISYRNSLIAERFSQIKTLKSNLATIEKENDQLEVNIESKLNLSNIEKKAKEELGMQKLKNSQTIYVNLGKQDYVEAATEEIIYDEEQNWFEQIISKIKELF